MYFPPWFWNSNISSLRKAVESVRLNSPSGCSLVVLVETHLVPCSVVFSQQLNWTFTQRSRDTSLGSTLLSKANAVNSKLYLNGPKLQFVLHSKTTALSLDFTFLCCGLESPCRSSQKKLGAHLMCVLSLKDHSFVLPVV